MYVIFEGIFISIILWITEVILLSIFLRKKSWKVHVPLQIFLFILIWPTANIGSNVIFYLDTEDGRASDVGELNRKYKIPIECKDIVYHYDPTHYWLYCSVNTNTAKRWLEENKYSSDNESLCVRFDMYPLEIQSKLKQESMQYFTTKLESNGAGASAMLNDDWLFLCKWYW